MWALLLIVLLLVLVAVIINSGRHAPKHLETMPPALVTELARLDAMMDRWLEGIEPSALELLDGGDALAKLYEWFAARCGTHDNVKFHPADRADFYVCAIKLTVLGHPDHDSWPMKSDIRRHVLGGLRRRDDPIARAALVMPALVKGKLAVATQAYRSLPDGLKELVVSWVRAAMVTYPEQNDVRVCDKFLHQVNAPWPVLEETLSLAQRWALSAAIYPSYAFDRRVGLAEARSPASSRLRLESWWGIVDGPSANEVLVWLLERGERERMGRELADRPRPSVASRREMLERFDIAAWDLCRLIHVTRAAANAGYLSEERAWNWIFVAARQLRARYPSWEALGHDFALGGWYSEDGQPDPIWAGLARWMYTSQKSPWRDVPWEIDPAELTPGD